MNNLDLLKKQHEEIMSIISEIENLVKKGDLVNSAKDIALRINTLAGKLKMHLLSEDKYLYPELINSGDVSLRTTTQRFYAEMGNLADVFTKFVQDYNIPDKILRNDKQFAADSKRIFEAIRKRINKEGSKLYPLIKAQNC